MAKFEICEGAPGQGKSLYTSRQALWLAKRNRKWAAKGIPLRPIASNMKFSPKAEKLWGIYDPALGRIASNGLILYWSDANELVKLRNVDILWDEIATELDAREFGNLSRELRRFLSQYRKRGLEIYANTQDFSMIDARARLMISGVKTLKKIIGSPDPSISKPKIKRIWGITLIRAVLNIREVDAAKKQYSFFDWSIMLIERELIELYDTTQDIPLGNPPPLHHEVRLCSLHGSGCDYSKVIHS